MVMPSDIEEALEVARATLREWREARGKIESADERRELAARALLAAKIVVEVAALAEDDAVLAAVAQVAEDGEPAPDGEPAAPDLDAAELAAFERSLVEEPRS